MARGRRAQHRSEENSRRRREREDEVSSSPFAAVVLKEKKEEKSGEKKKTAAVKGSKPSQIVQGYDPSASFADILYNWENTGNPYALPSKKRQQEISEKKTSFADILAQWEGKGAKKEEKTPYRRASQEYRATRSFGDILDKWEGKGEPPASQTPADEAEPEKDEKPVTSFFRKMEDDDEIPPEVSWSVFSGARDVVREKKEAQKAEEQAEPEAAKRVSPVYRASRGFGSILDEFETRKTKPEPEREPEKETEREDRADKGAPVTAFDGFKPMEEDDEIPPSVAWSVFGGAQNIQRPAAAEKEAPRKESRQEPEKKKSQPDAVHSRLFVSEAAKEPKTFDEILKEKGDLDILRKEKTITQLRAMLPQATLDLHGLTAEEAETALHRFITESLDSGIEKISVIHGKGLHSQDGVGVLRDVTVKVLEEEACCKEMSNAKPAFGGSGVTWVILKKKDQ